MDRCSYSPEAAKRYAAPGPATGAWGDVEHAATINAAASTTPARQFLPVTTTIGFLLHNLDLALPDLRDRARRMREG